MLEVSTCQIQLGYTLFPSNPRKATGFINGSTNVCFFKKELGDINFNYCARKLEFLWFFFSLTFHACCKPSPQLWYFLYEKVPCFTLNIGSRTSLASLYLGSPLRTINPDAGRKGKELYEFPSSPPLYICLLSLFLCRITVPLRHPSHP